VFILGILLVSVGVPLVLFAWRGPQLASPSRATLLSRETSLIVNNFLLTAATLIVLTGTFYPLGLEVMTGARITVGPPYFDATFTPVMAVLVICMAMGPLLVWRSGVLPSARSALLAGGTGAGLAAVAGAGLATGLSAAALAGLALGGWLALSIAGDIAARLKLGQAGSAAARLKAITGPVWGMWIAHFGMVLFLAGALGEGVFQTEVITRAQPGEVVTLAGRQVAFKSIEARQGPNYQTETAVIELRDADGHVGFMYPEKRFYPAARQTTTEAAIRTRLSGDDYMVLGDGDADSGYTLRLYHKPLISFIWLGAVFMALGGLVAISTRARVRPQSPAEV
ncbi:MAG: cytochrome c-type biogenesis CcmF C-terminal domain-containing protein, partial [Pseudomonadota bacterium]|nr:cytochrome c-type biogenesis CcmF C-terminal domain-containing protein [Pseudomonadota bacterium]